METQINSFFIGQKGVQVVRIFGYATKGIPGLEINGAGKLSKNIKEKIIYLTRARRLSTSLRRFVICVDLSDLEDAPEWQELKWLEFPILLLYWQLAGLLPIAKLDDCLCNGTILANGDICQRMLPENMDKALRQKMNPLEVKGMKVILSNELEGNQFWRIDAKLLLQHIPQLNFI